MQVFLPAENRCSLKFMQQILSDRKGFILRQNVPTMFVPNWPECGIKAIWPQAIRVEAFAKHMPDDWTATERTERRYFYGILTAIAPDFVIHMINEARTLRD